MNGILASVNVGGVRKVRHKNEDIATGIYKEPIGGRVPVRGVNLVGDDQADREAHGGPFRALYAYADVDYTWWSNEVGRPLEPGTFGENLTTSGLDVSGALIGERWRIGSATLQVTSPRIPCYKLAMRMDDPAFVRRFGKALRPGAYLAIVEEGELGAGDPIEIVQRPTHTLTVSEMAKIYLFEQRRANEMLVPELTRNWREWVEQRSASMPER